MTTEPRARSGEAGDSPAADRYFRQGIHCGRWRIARSYRALSRRVFALRSLQFSLNLNARNSQDSLLQCHGRRFCT